MSGPEARALATLLGLALLGLGRAGLAALLLTATLLLRLLTLLLPILLEIGLGLAMIPLRLLGLLR